MTAQIPHRWLAASVMIAGTALSAPSLLAQNCQTDADCDDLDACTQDACVDLLCEHTPANGCPHCAIGGAGNCHTLDTTRFGLISDIDFKPNGVIQADDFIPDSTEINSICAWGVYIDPRSLDNPDNNDCNGAVQDDFRIRIYADDNGLPGPLLAERSNDLGAFVTVSKSQTQVENFLKNSAIEPILLNAYTLTFPTISLPQAGAVYWLEVANNTHAPGGELGPNTCDWHWIASFPHLGGIGNSWSAAGTDPRADRPSGYLDLSGRWGDLAFCLSGPDGPVTFTDPPTPTGACCDCDDVCTDGLTMQECIGLPNDPPRRWLRNTACPASCLPTEGVPGDECSGKATPAAALGEATLQNDEANECIGITKGSFQTQTGCVRTDVQGFFQHFLGKDIWACFSSTCTGELVASMCATNLYYGNMDSQMWVYHDFDNPADCPCPDDSFQFMAGATDEDCDGLPDGGAGKFSGLIVFPGECWMLRMGGWGWSLAGTDSGYIALDVACQTLCDKAPVAAPVAETLDGTSNVILKNRYLSIRAEEFSFDQTFRVQAQDLPLPYDGWNGRVWYAGEPIQVCENAGQGINISPPNCGPAPGRPQRWFWAAPLVCKRSQAYFTDWTELTQYCVRGDNDGGSCNTDFDCPGGSCGADPTIHLFHRGIVPRGSYAVSMWDEVVSAECGALELSLDLPRWGDVVKNVTQCPNQPPNGDVDVLGDVVAIVQKFSNLYCAVSKTRADLQPGSVDLVIDISDAIHALQAFTGANYPFLPGVPCTP